MSIEYKLCAAVTAEDLNKEVNKFLADDWALYGAPFVGLSENDGKQMVYQAVTKVPKKVAGVR